MIRGLWRWLGGKKTNIAGGAMIVYGVATGSVETIALGVVSLTGRDAIRKVEKKIRGTGDGK